MTDRQQHAFGWQESSGPVECYESRIVTTWSEYIRGVVIAQERRAAAGGYTAYIEYFTYGVARQLWGGRIFPDPEQAKMWCEDQLAQIQGR
jgi:hypothetical protein